MRRSMLQRAFLRHMSIGMASVVAMFATNAQLSAANLQAECPISVDGAFLAPMTFHVDDPGAEPRVLMAVGEIVTGTTEQLRDTLENVGRIDEVWFHSPGGDGQEGLRLGGLLREYGIFTRVPIGATCFSACSYAFLGGPLRAIDPNSCYGVHMFTFGVEQSVASIVYQRLHSVETLQQLGEVTEDLGEILDGLEQRAARLARARADYLTRMSVSMRLMIPAFETESGTEYWLSREEMLEYNVVNVQ